MMNRGSDFVMLLSGQLLGAFRLDMQDRAAMFAVNGIRLMPAKSARRAFITHLFGPENSLDQAQKERDTEYHDQYRQQMATGAHEDNVAEAGRRQCCYREVKGIGIIFYCRIFLDLQHINDSGNDENEHKKIDDAEDDVFMVTDVG